MIKYSKFTDNIGSGNSTDTFCQNTDKFQKSVGGGGYAPPHPPLGTPFTIKYITTWKIFSTSYSVVSLKPIQHNMHYFRLIQSWQKNLDEPGFVAKPEAYDLAKESLQLKSDYLSYRKIGSAYSDWANIIRRIPQGSIFWTFTFQYFY